MCNFFNESHKSFPIIFKYGSQLGLLAIENTVESPSSIFTLYRGRCCGRDLFIFGRSVLGCLYHQLASFQVALDAGVVDADDQHDHQTKDEHDHACMMFHVTWGAVRGLTDQQGHSPWTHGHQTGRLLGGQNPPAWRRQTRRWEGQKSSWCWDTSPCPRQPPYWLLRARKYQKSIFYANLMNYKNKRHLTKK